MLGNPRYWPHRLSVSRHRNLPAGYDHHHHPIDDNATYDLSMLDDSSADDTAEHDHDDTANDNHGADHNRADDDIDNVSADHVHHDSAHYINDVSADHHLDHLDHL